jgi:hypothetical protein
MTIADYTAIGVLIVLAILAVVMLYLRGKFITGAQLRHVGWPRSAAPHSALTAWGWRYGRARPSK